MNPNTENINKHREDLGKLLRQSGLWRASSIGSDFADQKCCSTGFPQLDEQLPGKGWPSAGAMEILHERQGIGEFRLLLPAMARLSQEQARWLLLVSPPAIPYPPALAQAGVDLSRVIITQPRNWQDYLWVLEKALASQSCAMVLAWPGNIHYKHIRRLQVASREGNALGVLFRHEKEATQASPAELRLRVRPHLADPKTEHHSSAISVRVLKRRGGWESDELTISFNDQLARRVHLFDLSSKLPLRIGHEDHGKGQQVPSYLHFDITASRLRSEPAGKPVADQRDTGN